MRTALISLVCLLAAPIAVARGELIPFAISTNGMRDLSPALQAHLDRTKFPALAAAVLQGTNITAAGVVGVRKLGTTNSATLQDKFHIGSCTKSMTALLAVMLELEGKVRLTNRTADLLDWVPASPVRDATLLQLLQSHSGLGNEPDRNLWSDPFRATGSGPAARQAALSEFLKAPLLFPPGTKFHYSNFGYALAGAMLEKAAGQPWDDLVRTRVFATIGLHSGGFGPPNQAESIDQPWGHVWESGQAQPVPPEDNPPALAPAGAVHLSLLDTARYAAFHLATARGTQPSLKPFVSSLYKPHPGSDYALGWHVVHRNWARGEALTHAGSNTMFFSVIWIAPERNLAIVLSTNVGDPGNYVAAQCDTIIADLIETALD